MKPPPLTREAGYWILFQQGWSAILHSMRVEQSTPEDFASGLLAARIRASAPPDAWRDGAAAAAAGAERFELFTSVLETQVTDVRRRPIELGPYVADHKALTEYLTQWRAP